jgi:hypothetical protein
MLLEKETNPRMVGPGFCGHKSRSRPAFDQHMDYKEALATAGRTLMSDATLDELRQLASDLRTLSPDSALAELVEAKVGAMLADRTAAGDCPPRALRERGPGGPMSSSRSTI